MTKTAALDTIAAELAYLEANHADLTVTELRARRTRAIDAAEIIYNDDTSTGADFNRAHDLITALDRVGY